MVKIDYEKLGKSVGNLVAEKQEAYGDSFSKSHKILKVLYPEGIKTDQYMDVLTICRVVDKLFRLATDPNYGDESPWRDICGYSLLSMGKDTREMAREETPYLTPTKADTIQRLDDDNYV